MAVTRTMGVALICLGLLLWALLTVWQARQYCLMLEPDATRIRGLFRCRRIKCVQIADYRLSVL